MEMGWPLFLLTRGVTFKTHETKKLYLDIEAVRVERLAPFEKTEVLQWRKKMTQNEFKFTP